MTPIHFNGQMLDGTMRQNVHWLELQVDLPESQFLCLAYNVDPRQYCVLDIDDSNQVGAGKEWTGFTTGEVFLEVSFTANGNNSGILISEVAGQKLSGSNAVDSTTPSILFDGIDDIAPNALVNVRYEVPQPRLALDVIDGEVDLEKLEIKILQRKIYGYFVDVTHLYDGTYLTATEEGDYIIRYLLKDNAKNEHIRDLHLKVVSKTPFDTTLNMHEEYLVGETFMLGEIDVKCYTSLIYSEVNYLFNDKKIPQGAYEEVLFKEEGKLVVEYKFIAYGGEEILGKYEIDIIKSDKPVISSEGVNPYIIKGKTLILPTFEAIDYSKDESSEDYYPEKYYLVNGKRIEYSDKRYEVTEDEGETIHIQAVSNGAVKDFYVTVITPKYLSDYFIYDNVEVEEINGKDVLEYRFSKDTTFEYSNPLVASSPNGLIIELGLNAELSTATPFRVFLTDFYDKSESIYIDVEYKSGYYYIKLNGTGKTEKAITYEKNGKKYLRLTINNHSNKIMGVFTIDKYENGRMFDGFNSNLVNLKVVFENVVSETGFCVYSLVDKSFDSYFDDEGNLEVYEDISMPNIVFATSIYEQEINYGKKIIIPSAQVWSVLSGRYDVSVTVKSPTNNLIINQEDASLTYEVLLNEYGDWQVQYHYTSGSGLKKTHNLIISAKNDNIPVYTVDNVPDSTYSINDNIKIPVIKTSEELSINIALINSAGKYIFVNEGSLIKLEEKGIYRMIIYINNGYHYTTEFFEFEVK